MSEETALDWLAEKLRIEFGFVFSENILKEAKEIEKQKLNEAYQQGGIDAQLNYKHH